MGAGRPRSQGHPGQTKTERLSPLRSILETRAVLLRTALALAAFALGALLIALRTLHVFAWVSWIFTARPRLPFAFLVRLLIVRHQR
jgi:hypothetical protein